MSLDSSGFSLGSIIIRSYFYKPELSGRSTIGGRAKIKETFYTIFHTVLYALLGRYDLIIVGRLLTIASYVTGECVFPLPGNDRKGSIGQCGLGGARTL